VERVLAPTPHRDRVVMVMDNLTAHRGERVKEHIAKQGCELLYLPPYPPVFNPIEEDLSKIKGLMRKAEAIPETPCSRRWAWRSRHSLAKTPAAFSNTVGTVQQFNNFVCR
jgi:transposase